MQEELSHCPFCGKEPEMKLISVDEPVTNFDNYYEIRCPACLHEGLRIRRTVRRCTNTEEREYAKEELAYEWNEKIRKIHENMK